MNQSKIAVRYAKAFFEIAIEKQILDKVKNDMEFVTSTCALADFQLLLDSPVVKTSQKKELIQQIFKGKVQQITSDFLLMIADNKREFHIPMICLDFMEQYRTFKGFKVARVTTAFPIDDELKKQFGKAISEVFKTEVELSTNENADLIGGFILRVGDEQFDASVASKLKNIEREFLNKTI